MPRYFKGAAPGTHWHKNDARLTGFYVAPPLPLSPGAVVQHITWYSHPSPYISFSNSFAVAADYAVAGGPGGPATEANPAYVYEIDTDCAASDAVAIIEPLQIIAEATCGAKGGRPGRHHHDGGQNLILGLASRSLHGTILSTPPRRPGGQANPPKFDNELEALVFALRDSEVLMTQVPKECIIRRHDVS